jgi:hypothetical protein
MPVSSTSIATQSPSSWSRTEIRPPSPVNLKALDRRFITIFSSLSRSTKTGSGPAGADTVSVMLRLRAASSTVLA